MVQKAFCMFWKIKEKAIEKYQNLVLFLFAKRKGKMINKKREKDLWSKVINSLKKLETQCNELKKEWDYGKYK